MFKATNMMVLLLAVNINHAYAFFPNSPDQLTLLTNNAQTHPTLCPRLIKTSITPEPKHVTSPFKLLNWNIYKQQNKNWESSLNEWVNSADFITLQEAKLSSELITFSQQKELYYLHNYAFKYNNFIYGVNTFSKIAPLSLCASAYKEPWVRIPKTTIASTYSIKGSNEPLLLINFHGVNFTLTASPLDDQLSPYLALIQKHKGPVIFSGDFNTWSNARLLTVNQPLIQAGFSEVLFDSDKRLTAFGLPLDHIYFRGLKVIEAKSLTTEASDHSPQIVTFELIKPEKDKVVSE